jgi:hypothetical protein
MAVRPEDGDASDDGCASASAGVETGGSHGDDGGDWELHAGYFGADGQAVGAIATAVTAETAFLRGAVAGAPPAAAAMKVSQLRELHDELAHTKEASLRTLA